MKRESLVIADQHAAVNTYLGLVHTARHAPKEDLSESGSITYWDRGGRSALDGTARAAVAKAGIVTATAFSSIGAKS